MVVSREERKRRLRAVVAYSGFGNAGVAERAGIPKGTLGNWMSRTRTQALPPERFPVIARVCGVPITFLEFGFAPMEREMGPMERQVQELRAKVEELEAQR